MKLFIPATITAAAVAMGGIGYAVWNAPVPTASVTTDILAVNPAEQVLPDANLPLTPDEAVHEHGLLVQAACEVFLKQQLKDPSSYQNVSRTIAYDSSATTPNQVRVVADIRYRAKNSFNAYTVSTRRCYWDVYKGRVNGEVKYGTLQASSYEL